MVSLGDGAKIQEYIEKQIASGDLSCGGKLPTERALAEQFALSRSTVRSALKELERNGKIVRLVGRGTFVNQVAALPERHGGHNHDVLDASPAEVMDVRLILEPSVAELFVTRASGTDLQYLETCISRSEATSDLQEFEKWDTALHSAIVSAVKNEFLKKLFGYIDSARRQAEWGKLKRASLTEQRREMYQNEHRRIVDALKERDGPLARKLVEEHLRHVRRNLLGY